MEDNDHEESERRSSVAICGFLELAIHQLLFVKNVYPRDSFQKIVRRNTPTWFCKNSDVRDYIINFLDFTHGFLVQQHKIRVLFILKKSDESDDVVEQFVFECRVKDYLIRSNNQMIDIVDELITVCAAINKGCNLSEKLDEPFNDEFTFELQVRVKPPSVIPPVSPTYPFVIYENKEDDSWNKILPLRAETNTLYEMNAYVCEQPKEAKRPPLENFITLPRHNRHQSLTSRPMQNK